MYVETTYLDRQKVLQISVALPAPDASNQDVNNEHREVELHRTYHAMQIYGVCVSLTFTFGYY